VTDFLRFVRILAEDIIPLLEEYCYEDYGALTQILGKDMVDEPKQRIREELFAPPRRQELVQALLSPAPEIVTSPDAILSPVMEEADDSEQDEGDK
jgi:5-methylcytosine-specific restriction enzyme B